jgi:hypothetical protein
MFTGGSPETVMFRKTHYPQFLPVNNRSRRYI